MATFGRRNETMKVVPLALRRAAYGCFGCRGECGRSYRSPCGGVFADFGWYSFGDNVKGNLHGRSAASLFFVKGAMSEASQTELQRQEAEGLLFAEMDDKAREVIERRFRVRLDSDASTQSQ